MESKQPPSHNPNLELQWRQITCQRSINANTFAQGVQDFNFSIGAPQALVPSKCYLRYKLKLTKADGLTPIEDVDNVAIADNAIAACYDNIYMRLGGQDCSSITQYCTQADQVKTRLGKSGAWLDSIGAGAMMKQAPFAHRQDITSIRTTFPPGFAFQSPPDGGIPLAGTIEVKTADGTIAGVGTALNTPPQDLKVGDVVYHPAHGTFRVSVAATADDGTSAVLTPFPPADIGATAGWVKVSGQSNSNIGKGEVYVMWQPSIGFFGCHEPVGAGDFKLQLNPKPGFATAAVQSIVAAKTSADYKFTVESAELYIATINSTLPPSMTRIFPFQEMQVQSKQLAPGSTESLLDFTVPPSTHAITVFVQETNAGSTTLLTPTMFKMVDKSDENLTGLQLQYANTAKPATRWTSDSSGTADLLQQRYLDTQMYSGRIMSAGGSETYADWRTRGPLYHFTFHRDASDRSTYLQVSATFENLGANANLFVVAHFSTAVEVVSENGFIVSVLRKSL